NTGRFMPKSSDGQYLLAHELVHSIQQGVNPYASWQRLSIGDAETSHEHEANGVANLIMRISGSQADSQVGFTRALEQAGTNGTATVSRQVSDRLIQRQPTAEESKMRSALEHAAGASAGILTPAEYAQLKCVIRRGGCPQSREGGTPEAQNIDTYNKECRGETGYSGVDVAPTPDQCEELRPGMLEVVHQGRLRQLQSLLKEYAALVQADALEDYEISAIDDAIKHAEEKLGTLIPSDEPKKAPAQDKAPWVITS